MIGYNQEGRMTETNVLIIGGGYAGVMCALRIAGGSRGKMRITLVNSREAFVERLRLHENLVVAPKYDMRSFDYETFLGARGINFICGKVVSLDRRLQSVEIADTNGTQTSLTFETLVIATGSVSSKRHITGQEEHVYAMNIEGSNNSRALSNALGNHSDPRVTVIGGGATGIELAAEVAQKPRASVTLVSRHGLGEAFTKPVRRHAVKTLEKLGVVCLENEAVESIHKDHVQTSSQSIPHDLCVSATGFRVDPIWLHAGLTTLPNGRIQTDAFLRAKGETDIFCAGDASFAEPKRSAPARMSVMYAMTSGAHVANAILDIHAGKIPKRFGFWTYGQAIGLGSFAVGFGNMRYDKAYPPYFTGRTGYHMRHFFVAVLFRLLMLEARYSGLPFYLGRPWRRDRKLWEAT